MHEVMNINSSNLISTIQIHKVQNKFNGLRITMIILNNLTFSINGENKQNDQIALFLHMVPIASNGQDQVSFLSTKFWYLSTLDWIT